MKISEVTYVGSKSIDREAGIIHDVRVLGRESKNGREYSRAAMEQAAKFYEGRDVNIDHPARTAQGAERSVADGFGWLESVQIRDDGVYANLHYLKEHPVAGLVTEAAERNPRRFGLSHNAEGEVKRINGKNVVESVKTVHSVDLVQNPATNAGLFESESRTVRELLEAEAPDLLNAIDEALLEDSALLPPEAMDAPMEGPGEDPSANVKAAIVQLLTAALEGEGDPRAIVLKIMDTAQALLAGMPEPETPDETAMEPGEEPDPTDPNSQQADPTADPKNPDPAAGQTAGQDPANQADPNNPFAKRKKKMAESTKTPAADPAVKQLVETVSKLTETVSKLTEAQVARDTRDAAKSLIESMNRDATDIRITAVARETDEAARKELVESWPERVAVSRYGSRPAISAPLREAAGSETIKFPSTHQEFVAALR